jgi:hypothetical protein
MTIQVKATSYVYSFKDGDGKDKKRCCNDPEVQQKTSKVQY